MIPSIVSRPLGSLFAAIMLDPIRLGSAVMPHAIWPPLAWISHHVAWGAARASRPFLPRGHLLAAAMGFVHLAESVVGIEGQWETLDERTAVRRVHHCPHAARLGRTTQFCTDMGEALGQGLSEALVDDPSVRFEVIRTRSQGHPCCEYRLTVAS